MGKKYIAEGRAADQEMAREMDQEMAPGTALHLQHQIHQNLRSQTHHHPKKMQEKSVKRGEKENT